MTIELVERKGPELFRFEKEGDSIRGRLVTIDSLDVNGKATVRYTLHDEEQDRVFSFLATVDLLSKIRQSDTGKVLQITYDGSGPSAHKDKHPMKRFKVYGEGS